MKLKILTTTAIVALVFGFFWKDRRNALDFLHPPKRIKVKVLGMVAKPGVYELEQGSTVQTVLERAGLSKPNPEIGLLLHQKVQDGQILYIGKEYQK